MQIVFVDMCTSSMNEGCGDQQAGPLQLPCMYWQYAIVCLEAHQDLLRHPSRQTG